MDPNKEAFLKSVLKYSIANTDGTSSTSVTEMDPERRNWLKEVLENSTVDPLKELKICIANLVSDSPDEEKISALSTIQEWCEDLNFSNDFHKIGGFDVLRPILVESNAEMKWRAADIVATLVQNYDYCQKAVLDAGFLPILLNILDSEKENEEVLVKTLFAVSALTRDNKDGQEHLLRSDGLSVILRVMCARASDRIRTKAAFMLSALCSSEPRASAELHRMGMVSMLVAIYKEMEPCTSSEHALSTLLTLARTNSEAFNECGNADYRLKEVLQARLRAMGDDERFVEERDLCVEFVNLLEHGKSDYSAER